MSLSKLALMTASVMSLVIAPRVLARDESAMDIGVSLDAGQTAFNGNLSDDRHAPTAGLEVDILKSGSSDTRTSFGGALGGLHSFLSVDFTNTTTKTANQTPFPFDAGKNVTLSESALLGNFCAMANHPVQACLGLGWSQVQVEEGSANEQNYGTFRGDFRLGRFFSDGLLAGVKAHYYQVDQVVSGTHAGFNAFSYEALAGWQWQVGQ